VKRSGIPLWSIPVVGLLGFALAIALAAHYLMAPVGPSGDREVSDEEARELGGKLIEALHRADEPALRELLDEEAMLEHAGLTMKLNRMQSQAFARGLRAATPPFSWSTLAAKGMEPSTQLTILRVREVDGHRALLVRAKPTQGVAYFDALLALDSSGRCRVVQVRSAVGGPVSDYVATIGSMRIMLKSVPFFGKWTGDTLKDKAGDKLDMTPYEEAGEMTAGILMQLHALPPAPDAVAGLSLVPESEASSPEARAWTLKRIQELIEKDKAMPFMLMDGHVLNGDFAGALAQLEAFDQTLGGDPFLDAYRAVLVAKLGRTEEARALAEKAVAAVPTLTEAWDVALRLARERGAAVEVTRLEAEKARNVPR